MVKIWTYMRIYFHEKLQIGLLRNLKPTKITCYTVAFIEQLSAFSII